MSRAGEGDFVRQADRADAVLKGVRLSDKPNAARTNERTRARRYVASRAHDADDCRLLLDAIGLLEQP